MRFIAYLLCGSLCLPFIQGLRFPGPKLFGRVGEFPGKLLDEKFADRSGLLGVQHLLRRFPSWDRKPTTLLAQKSNDKSIAKSPAADDSDISSDMKVTGLWVAAAAAFAGVIAVTKGPNSAIEFCSGYLLEQSLSIDNLFVFLVLFDYFGVAKDKQDRVLTYGIWGGENLAGSRRRQ
jgi:Integral membrane protein TerC family